MSQPTHQLLMSYRFIWRHLSYFKAVLKISKCSPVNWEQFACKTFVLYFNLMCSCWTEYENLTFHAIVRQWCPMNLSTTSDNASKVNRHKRTHTLKHSLTNVAHSPCSMKNIKRKKIHELDCYVHGVTFIDCVFRLCLFFIFSPFRLCFGVCTVHWLLAICNFIGIIRWHIAAPSSSSSSSTCLYSITKHYYL